MAPKAKGKPDEAPAPKEGSGKAGTASGKGAGASAGTDAGSGAGAGTRSSTETAANAGTATTTAPPPRAATTVAATATTTTPPRASATVASTDLLQPVVRRAPEKIEPMMQLIAFPLGREEYAVRIGQVKEITVTPEIARMPRTPEFIRGVANIRGELIAVLDLEERFQMPPMAPNVADPRTYTLVVEAADYSIGILVRSMPQATTVPLALLERAPDFLQTLPSINDKYIEGLIRLPDVGRVIILLDLFRLLKPEEILQLNIPEAVTDEGGAGAGRSSAAATA